MRLALKMRTLAVLALFVAVAFSGAHAASNGTDAPPASPGTPVQFPPPPVPVVSPPPEASSPPPDATSPPPPDALSPPPVIPSPPPVVYSYLQGTLTFTGALKASDFTQNVQDSIDTQIKSFTGYEVTKSTIVDIFDAVHRKLLQDNTTSPPPPAEPVNSPPPPDATNPPPVDVSSPPPPPVVSSPPPNAPPPKPIGVKFIFEETFTDESTKESVIDLLNGNTTNSIFDALKGAYPTLFTDVTFTSSAVSYTPPPSPPPAPVVYFYLEGNLTFTGADITDISDNTNNIIQSIATVTEVDVSDVSFVSAASVASFSVSHRKILSSAAPGPAPATPSVVFTFTETFTSEVLRNGTIDALNDQSTADEILTTLKGLNSTAFAGVSLSSAATIFTPAASGNDFWDTWKNVILGVVIGVGGALLIGTIVCVVKRSKSPREKATSYNSINQPNMNPLATNR